MWHGVPRDNIQQNSYIPQTEQHLPFGLMLLLLGNVTIICNLREYIAVTFPRRNSMGHPFRLCFQAHAVPSQTVHNGYILDTKQQW